MVADPDADKTDVLESDEDDGEATAGNDDADTTESEASKSEDDDPLEKLRKHEESEAKRKAEWEAAQAEKKAAADAQMAKVTAMSPEELEKAAMARIGDDLEKITHRNLKEYVAEHIQTKCIEDHDFAKLTLHPNKNLVKCVLYINRMALEYLKNEMKVNGEKIPTNWSAGVGCAVPQEPVYEWAEAYFRDMDAEEDKTEDDKFVPKMAPYVPAADKKKAAAAKKKAEADKKAAAKTAAAEKKAADKKAAEEKAAAEKLAKNQVSGQITLGDVA